MGIFFQISALHIAKNNFVFKGSCGDTTLLQGKKTVTVPHYEELHKECNVPNPGELKEAIDNRELRF